MGIKHNAGIKGCHHTPLEQYAYKLFIVFSCADQPASLPLRQRDLQSLLPLLCTVNLCELRLVLSINVNSWSRNLVFPAWENLSHTAEAHVLDGTHFEKCCLKVRPPPFFVLKKIMCVACLFLSVCLAPTEARSRPWDLLELEFQAVVSCLVVTVNWTWVLWEEQLVLLATKLTCGGALSFLCIVWLLFAGLSFLHLKDGTQSELSAVNVPLMRRKETVWSTVLGRCWSVSLIPSHILEYCSLIKLRMDVEGIFCWEQSIFCKLHSTEHSNSECDFIVYMSQRVVLLQAHTSQCLWRVAPSIVD